MNKLFKKPHLIFWLSIPLIILIGFLNGKESIDINVHDTYYVIEHAVLATLISILFGIIGLGYWIMYKFNRQLFKLLNLIHIVITICGFLAILLIHNLNIESEFPLFDDTSRENLIITLIVILITFGQIIYFINMFYGLFKKRKITSD